MRTLYFSRQIPFLLFLGSIDQSTFTVAANEEQLEEMYDENALLRQEIRM